MRKTISVAVLVLVFCSPVAAGIIHNPAPSPSPMPSSVMEEPADDATVDDISHTPAASESLTEIALELLAVLPALF